MRTLRGFPQIGAESSDEDSEPEEGHSIWSAPTTLGSDEEEQEVEEAEAVYVSIMYPCITCTSRPADEMVEGEPVEEDEDVYGIGWQDWLDPRHIWQICPGIWIMDNDPEFEHLLHENEELEQLFAAQAAAEAEEAANQPTE